MAELFVVNGICGGTVFFLPDVPTVLGRSPECHIQVADPWISSMHALFERRGDQLWVVDLDSRNGTFVDEQRVHEAAIQPGARLRFGKTSAELRAHAEQTTPPGILSDQRTIIRYIADLAAEAGAAGLPRGGAPAGSSASGCERSSAVVFPNRSFMPGETGASCTRSVSTKVPFRLSRSTTQSCSPRRSKSACMLEIQGSATWMWHSGERPSTVGTSGRKKTVPPQMPFTTKSSATDPL